MKTKILYYISTFPVLSENFINRELEALLKEPDLELAVLALQRGKKAVLSPALARITTYYSKTKMQRLLEFWVYFSYFLQHPLKFLKAFFKYRSRILSLGTALSLVPFVENFKPSIIHGNWLTEGALMCSILSDLTGIPFSVQCHANDIWLSKKDDIRDRVRDSAFVATCTEFNKKYLENLLKGDYQNKIQVVYHYIDPQIYGGKTTTFNDKPVLYLIGRKVEKKGYTYFLQAAKILKDKGLVFEARIAGDDGPETPRLLALHKELDLEDVVKFTGEVTFEEHSHNFYESDVYVIPSIHDQEGGLDGIPYTLVEAAFAGLPLVATNVSAIPELIEDGRNGFLVEEKNAQSLADKLEILIKDKNMRISFGKAARSKVLTMYGYENTVKKLHDLFLKV